MISCVFASLTFVIFVHVQLSKGKTQYPFSKSPGNVQSISFHPSRPFLFVVTQQHVKVFHLIEQKMVKKLMSGCKWLSSIDIHPSGDHVIVGSYDRRVVWFDMDLSSTPYKTLKFHEKAVRNVQFHRYVPIFNTRIVFLSNILVRDVGGILSWPRPRTTAACTSSTPWSTGT